MRENIINQLAEFGLTRYEAQSYMSLCEQENMTAEAVATKAEVPKGRIYDVLNSLAEQSLICSDDRRPKRYSPITPTRGIDRLLSQRLEELEDQRADYEQSAAVLKRSLSALETDEDAISFSTSALHHDDARDLIFDRFETATESISIVINKAVTTAEMKTEIIELFQSKVANGIEIRVLVEEKTQIATLLAEVGVTIRVVDKGELPEHQFAIIDGTEACIEVIHPADLEQLLAVINFRNEQAVKELKEMFESAWRTATLLTG